MAEEFGGIRPSEIPEVCLDGRDVDQLKREENKGHFEDGVFERTISTPKSKSEDKDKQEVQKCTSRLRRRGSKSSTRTRHDILQDGRFGLEYAWGDKI